MPPLRRKINSIKIPSLKNLSGLVGKVIEILAKEEIIVKGGFAKIILGELLKAEGKIENNLALGYKSETDLDLVITFSGSKKKNIDIITTKVKDLKEKFMKLGVDLDEKDIEMKRGNLKDSKYISKFLQSRDLTINEVIFIPSQETLFFTDKCLRDTINSAGILAANHPGTLRRDCGRIIASPRGMVRLIRFLIEKKVTSIYMPYWWVRSNKEEAERMQQGVLGAYGLALIDRYKRNEVLQLRLMNILNNLNITNLKNFETFKKEQEILFEGSRGEKFVLKKRSFEDIQEDITSGKERRELSRKKLKEKRKKCSHERKKQFFCENCYWHCKIIKCLDCDAVAITPKGQSKPFLIDDLFCNKNLIRADVYWDKNGFFQTPKSQLFS
jgi:hypothetical protein